MISLEDLEDLKATGIQTIIVDEHSFDPKIKKTDSEKKTETQKLAAALFDVGANYIYQSGGMHLLNLVFEETKKLLVGEHGEK